MDRLQMLQEADRRGLLPPEKSAMLAEATRRGLTSPTEPAPVQGVKPNPTDDMSAMELGFAGAGKAVVDLGRGARQMISKVPLVNRADIFNPEMVQAEVDESRKLDAPLMATTAGKVGNVAGSVASTMLVPGAGTYAGAAGMGAALGALQPTVEGESRALNTGIGAGGGVAGKFVGDKVGKWIFGKAQERAAQTVAQKAKDSVKNATLAAAQKEGYVVTPSQAGAGVGSRLLEGISGKVKTEQLAGIKNQRVTEGLVRRGLGLPDDAPLTSETMQALRNQAFVKGYEPITKSGIVATDKTYSATLDKIAQHYTGATRSFPNALKDDVKHLTDSFRVKFFDADDAISATKILREDATAAFRSGNNVLGKANNEVARAIEDKIERQLMAQGKEGAEMLKNFRDARVLMAKSHTVEDAIIQGGGKVDALKFAARVQKGKPMTGELKTIGDFANVFKEVSRVPKSGDANPLTVLDYVAGGFGLGVHPAAADIPATRVAARYGILSKPYQNALVKPNYPSSWTIKHISDLVNNPVSRAAYPAIGANAALNAKANK